VTDEELIKSVAAIDKEVELTRETANLLRHDLRLEQAGIKIVYALDCFELNRYLMPILDDTRNFEPDRFYTEQLAIHFVFESQKGSLLLLSPYVNEFRRTFATAWEHFVWLLRRDPVLQKQVIENIFKNKEVRASLNILSERAEGATEDFMRMAFGRARTSLFDSLIERYGHRYLDKALDTFQELVERKELLFASAVVEDSSKLFIDRNGADFKAILDLMNTARPRLSRNNEVDAEAACQLSRANAIPGKTVFYLVSSAREIREILASIHFQTPLQDPVAEKTSLLRDLYYFLMRMYFVEESPRQSLLKLNDFINLIGRYFDAVRKFYGYCLTGAIPSEFSPEEITAETHQLYEEIKKELEAIKSLPFSYPHYRTLASRIKTLVSEAVKIDAAFDELNTIREMVKKPELFRGYVTDIIAKLNESIQRLELFLSRFEVAITPKIRRRVGLTDITYDVLVMDKQDPELVRLVKNMIKELDEGTDESLARAIGTSIILDSKYPHSVDGHVMIAKVYRSKGDFAKAEEILRQAESLNANHPEIYFERSVIARRKALTTKKYDYFAGAFDNARRAVALAKDNPKYLKELAFLYWIRQESVPDIDEKEAKKNAEQSVKLTGDALKLAEARGDEPLIMSICNDLAYYLALRSTTHEDLTEARRLIDKCLSIQEKLKTQKRDAFYETRGFVSLREYEEFAQTNINLLLDAMSFFMKALDLNRDNKWARRNFEKTSQYFFAHAKSSTGIREDKQK
jgi:tetratricopeptide (TPR) repeat protein